MKRDKNDPAGSNRGRVVSIRTRAFATSSTSFRMLENASPRNRNLWCELLKLDLFFSPSSFLVLNPPRPPERQHTTEPPPNVPSSRHQQRRPRIPLHMQKMWIRWESTHQVDVVQAQSWRETDHPPAANAYTRAGQRNPQ